MRVISQRVKEKINSDTFFTKCSRQVILKDHTCQGRLTMEHTEIYGGRQIDEAWAIIGLCAFAHGVDQFQDGGILNKEINRWIAINRMTEEDEAKYSKRNWKREREYLNGKYGVPSYQHFYK